MGPIDALRRSFQTRKDMAMLEKYLPQATIDQVLKDDVRREAGELKEGQVEFVLVRVQEHRPDQVAGHVAAVIEAALHHRAMVGAIVSSVILIWFGAPRVDPDAQTRRRGLVEHLRRDLGENVAVVHGSRRALVGNLGNDAVMRYGPVLPGFHHCLAALFRLDYGTDLEV